MRLVEKTLLAGLVLVVFLLGICGVLVFRFTAESNADRESLVHTFQTIRAAQSLYAQVQAAETGQRGYLLTQNDQYLAPYTRALTSIPDILDTLKRLLAGDPLRLGRLQAIDGSIHKKLGELAETIDVAKKQGFEAARQIVLTDVGLSAMEDIQNSLRGLVEEESALSASRLQSSREWERRVLFIAIGTTILIVIALLVAAALIFSGQRRLRLAEQALSQQATHLQAALDNIRSGVAMFDAEGRLTAWNRRFFKLLALPTGLARTGQPLTAFQQIDPGGALPIFTGSMSDATGSSSAGAAESAAQRLKVDRRELEVHQSAMPDGGFIISLTDITQRLRAEAMLQQAQKMEAIGQLTGGVAHDFNNLLQIVMGNLNILAREMQGNEPALRRIRNALLGADRGASLTRHLLAFSRRQPLSPVPINLGRLIRNMTDLLRRSLGEQVQIETVIDGGLWNTLVDPSQVESAILNMAINARDAMPQGGKLTIEAGNAFLDDAYAAEHMEVTPGQYVMLAMTDTGTGMTPEVLAHAFDPFFTTKEEGRGTGLGLSMVWGFVKQSGGHVSIYSEMGEGTTIKVYLPREMRAEEQADTPHDKATHGGRERILIVEDDTQVRQAVVEMMSQIGYHTVTAEDGERALDLLHRGTPIDLLFTDVVIPGSIGSRELARRAKSLLPELQVVYTSGYTENAVIHHGRLDPGVDLLSKPYSIEELARKLRSVFDARRDTAASPAADHGRRRVLVVEDDALVRLATVESLTDLGFATAEAETGRQALGILAAQDDIDLLVTDVGLPDIDGHDLATQARELRPKLKIVLSSGYSRLTQKKNGNNGPPDALRLHKPYQSEDLRRVIEKLGA
jgi:signal transduction histidine kinase/DNA-binding response OmpR family regulator